MKIIDDNNENQSKLNLGKVKKSFKKPSKLPKIPFNKKIFIRVFVVFIIIIGIFFVSTYFLVVRPVVAIMNDAKDLTANTYLIKKGFEDLNYTEIKTGLDSTKTGLNDFRTTYEKNMKFLRKLPKVEGYYQDSQHLITAAEESIELGELTLSILEPYAEDLGFATGSDRGNDIPAQDRIIKLLTLMPEFFPKIKEISDRVSIIDGEISKIDASRYPTSLPKFVERFGVPSDLNLQEQILTTQAVTHELSQKAPQLEAFFNSIPEFMGLNEPKKYLVLMANNYEARMSGGFNTYIVLVEFDKGIPQITYSIDTYFIDEGERTGSSVLVNRNVPAFLRNYLYIQDRGGRLYARDATSTSPDFPTAAGALIEGFWSKDRSLPQDINGVMQVNNDVAVEMLKIVGPVSTDKYSILTDQGTYITVPVTEFNADNVIEELENIAGGKLAETIGRKEIVKFLAQSLFEKIFTSEATNLMSIAQVVLNSLSRKDVILYSFSPEVQKAFEDLGYGGRIVNTQDESWDYLHVNRSNFGSGKADWTKEGFVTQTVNKSVEEKDGAKISTVEVTIKNPKRPDWYNIDPCCFYKAYMRVYTPKGSKLVSVTSSDGQDPKAQEFVDEQLNKTYFETYTTQPKETDLTLTYVYELPASVDTNNYKLLIQRQSGLTSDPYSVKIGNKTEEFLLNSDKIITVNQN